MTILAGFTGLAGLTTGNVNAATRESNTTSAQIGPYVTDGSKLFGDDNGSSISIASTATLNFKGYIYLSGGSGTRAIWVAGNSGTDLFRLLVSGANLAMQYWNGSTWVSLDNTAIAVTTLYELDIEIVMNNSTGSIKLYVDQTEVQSLTGADTILDTPTTMNEVLFRSHNTTATDAITWSACVLADEELKDVEVSSTNLTGAGTNSSFTGAYTDVDEAGVDDTDVISTTTDGHVSTFAFGNLSGDFTSGYDVVGLIVNCRARRGPSGVANLRACAYEGTTLGEGSSTALGVTYAPVRAVFATNPDTAAAWTVTEINAAEVGAKAIST